MGYDGVEDDFEAHLQELRRGTVVLACLRLLGTAGYGYRLLEDLARRGFAVDANTLYPLLRRLEKQGYLTSEWDTGETRPRKFYRTSAAGHRLADSLSREWSALTTAIGSLTGGAPTDATSTHGTRTAEEH